MNETTENVGQAISVIVTQNRKRLMWFGILSLVFGIAGTFMSVAMTMTSIIFLGFLVVFAGVVFLVEAFSSPQQWKGKLFDFILALLYIGSGMVMIINPAGSAVWFTLFIAAFLIVIGVMRIVVGFKIKNEISEWGWMVFGGILSIILGILIYAQWPMSGLWVIGLFISIELIIQGFNAIVLSRIVKATQEDIREELGA